MADIDPSVDPILYRMAVGKVMCRFAGVTYQKATLPIFSARIQHRAFRKSLGLYTRVIQLIETLRNNYELSFFRCVFFVRAVGCSREFFTT